MCKFKKGDLVVRTQDVENLYWIRNKPDGDIFKVSGIEDSHLRLEDCSHSLFNIGSFELVKPEHPNPPKKHRDVIIAWANGADIETNVGNGWEPNPQPLFTEQYEYRVAKPKTDKERIAELEARVKELENR
jgi:hypothetical protein